MKYILMAFLFAVIFTSVLFLIEKAIENDCGDRNIAWLYWFAAFFVLAIGGISMGKVGALL